MYRNKVRAFKKIIIVVGIFIIFAFLFTIFAFFLDTYNTGRSTEDLIYGSYETTVLEKEPVSSNRDIEKLPKMENITIDSHNRGVVLYEKSTRSN